MPEREITNVITALEVTEGAGVSVFRSIGTPALHNLDPFLMLDQFCTDDPDDYIAGFPDHPHRGFNTFTYMLDGHMRHGDSMGNRGDLGPGGAQWMKAASGVIHSEMPQQESGRMLGFQLWINLPAALKMSEPEYQEVRPTSIPEIATGDTLVRVVAGKYAGRVGPVTDTSTDFQFLDVRLPAGGVFSTQWHNTSSAFIYPYRGELRVANTRLRAQQLAVLGTGETLRISAGDDGTGFLLVSGRPIGEPIVQYGPFVMNSREEIEQAMRDYRNGRLVQNKASMVNH
jgi:redox-sensitive bicupin YhaK (pirin superfamily)